MSGRGRGFSPGGRGGGGRGRDGGGGRYVVLVCVFVLCCQRHFEDILQHGMYG